MADRIADVEVYLDSVRRPLKYDERLYAGRGSTAAGYALQTLAIGTERAQQLADGHLPWMTQSGVRGFYSRIDGSAQPYLLTMPENYDATATRQYRLDVFTGVTGDRNLKIVNRRSAVHHEPRRDLGPAHRCRTASVVEEIAHGL